MVQEVPLPEIMVSIPEIQKGQNLSLIAELPLPEIRLIEQTLLPETVL